MPDCSGNFGGGAALAMGIYVTASGIGFGPEYCLGCGILLGFGIEYSIGCDILLGFGIEYGFDGVL